MKMQTIGPIMVARKQKELQNIVNILRKFIPFNMAILYGQYVQGMMCSERGGYELMLVTAARPEYEGWELEKLLNELYPYEIRADTRIHIETACINDINRYNTANWFYANIRNDGRILYDSGEGERIFRKSGFRYTKIYKSTHCLYDRFFSRGSLFLDEAERAWGERQASVAAIQLYYASLFLFRTLEVLFYGDHIQTENIWRSYKRGRHFSREMLDEFSDVEQTSSFFSELAALRQKVCTDNDFLLKTTKYKTYLRRLRTVQQIIRRSGEQHLSYLERCKSGIPDDKETEIPEGQEAIEQ